MIRKLKKIDATKYLRSWTAKTTRHAQDISKGKYKKIILHKKYLQISIT